MKLIFERWKEFLEEEQQPLMGVVVSFEKDYTISLSLINLSYIKEQLENSDSIDEFTQKIKNKTLYDKAIVGYIHAGYNPMYSKAGPTMGGSGGNCAGTYSVRQSIGKGYGKLLYNALLGFAAKNDIFIAADRHSVSAGAQKRWAKIDSQTDEEVPSLENPYIGTFDDYRNKETPPPDDDCIVHGVRSLDKGYKDTKQINYYNQLKNNLDNFFKTEIESMFNEPNFFGKLFGQAPTKRAKKLQQQLLKLGRAKFHAWELEALKDRTLR